MVRKFILLTILSIITYLDIFSLTVSAQPDLCNDQLEMASSSTRIFQLKDIGIELDIPANYRAIKKQDGSIEFVTAKEYEIIQAIKKGQCFSLEYYSMTIEAIDLKDELNLENTLIQQYTYGKEIVQEYNSKILFGYIVTSREAGMIECPISFIGKIAGKQQLLKVVAGDGECPIKINQMTDFLDTFREL